MTVSDSLEITIPPVWRLCQEKFRTN